MQPIQSSCPGIIFKAGEELQAGQESVVSIVWYWRNPSYIATCHSKIVLFCFIPTKVLLDDSPYHYSSFGFPCCELHWQAESQLPFVSPVPRSK
jgi:hypothetical protein